MMMMMMMIYHTSDVVLSREAMLTVSPNKQYWGVFSPTNPAATGPVCMPDWEDERWKKWPWVKYVRTSSFQYLLSHILNNALLGHKYYRFEFMEMTKNGQDVSLKLSRLFWVHFSSITIIFISNAFLSFLFIRRNTARCFQLHTTFEALLGVLGIRENWTNKLRDKE